MRVIAEQAAKAKGIPALALGDKLKWEAAHLFEDVLLGTLGLHVTPVIVAASDWSYVYVRLADGSSTVRGPEHHWSLRTSTISP